MLLSKDTFSIHVEIKLIKYWENIVLFIVHLIPLCESIDKYFIFLTVGFKFQLIVLFNN